MMNPKTLYQPPQSQIEQANLTKYMAYLKATKNLHFADYQALWQWSVEKTEDFWESLITYFDIPLHSPYERVLQGQMPDNQWFEGATLNYAEYVFRNKTTQRPAIMYQAEGKPLQEISWQQLEDDVNGLSNFLRKKGIQQGDSVVGYLPNIPEATVALLATMSLGAVWSSASPDFGVNSVLERFGQINPKVLVAVDGYSYGGKFFDKTEVISYLVEHIPSLEVVIVITSPPSPLSRGEGELLFASPLHGRGDSGLRSWQEALSEKTPMLTFTPVPFQHPIWVLYSSGTTGKPKAITHGHGGMLLEHLKYLHFHNDVKAGERFFWYTTTGWMMWNFVNAALLVGATIVLYDGSPGYPNMNVLWQMTADAQINHFGTSAAFVLSCMKAAIEPKLLNLSHLRSIGCTGSPLPPEGFDWIYDHVKPDVWLSSMSGGTDVCTAFVGGNPLLPVYEGEIQCRTLGTDMQAFDSDGKPLINEVGEMVLTQPLPSMPIYFWNDPEKRQYKASYFEEYEGIWRHGDWLKITDRNSLLILGRSDATLNRNGIRIGTSEIYRSVEKLEAIQDSLILNIEKPDGTSFMPLFVVLKKGYDFNPELKKAIAKTLRADYSPRHVPDEVYEIPDIPYTISGKKLELPIKKILMGIAPEKALNLGAIRNPDAVAYFLTFREKMV